MEGGIMYSKLLFFGGMKHCGKTNHGRSYAKHLGCSFDDLDFLIEDEIEAEIGKKICCRDFFTQKGKDEFQRIEALSLKKWIENHKNKFAVLSLGGGIASNNIAFDIIKNAGNLIYISQEEEILFDRIIKRGIPPFLQTENPKETFHLLYTERSQIYKQHANIILNPGNLCKEETFEVIKKELDAFIKKEGIRQ